MGRGHCCFIPFGVDSWYIVNGENLNESEIRLSLPAGVRSGLDKMSKPFEYRLERDRCVADTSRFSA